MAENNTTVGSTIYQRLKHDIIYGELKPGAKLKLDTLKGLYDASLSTLRETLNRLASEGFVDAPSQRGFFVKPVNTEDLEEISNLRILLECHALDLSIQNGDTEWEGNLVAAHHKLHLMEQQVLDGDETKVETWKRYDWEFHLAMIEACKSKNLLSLHSILFDKYLRYQMLVLTYRGKDAIDEHRAMFEATLARDSEKARYWLELHIKRGLDHTLQSMKWAKV